MAYSDRHAVQTQVAIELILLPRHENERAAPLRRIAKMISQMFRVRFVAEDGVFRSECGTNSGRHRTHIAATARERTCCSTPANRQNDFANVPCPFCRGRWRI